MAIFKLVAIAIICAVLVLYLKNTRPELAFGAAIASSILLLTLILKTLSPVLDFFNELKDYSGIDSQLIKLVLKIVGIGYLTEFSAGLIEEFGSKSIADKLVLGGKLIILVMSLPILKSMLDLIVAVLK